VGGFKQPTGEVPKMQEMNNSFSKLISQALVDALVGFS